MSTIRRMAALAAAGAMAVGLAACEPERPYFGITQTSGVQVSAGFAPVAGDFDADGYDDIWWFHPTGQDRLWEGRADGRFAHMVAPTQLQGPHEGVVGDFGGDAADDVLWVPRTEGTSTLVVTQAGGGAASTRPVDLPAGGWLATVVDGESRDGVLLGRYGLDGTSAVWDPDRGTDALTPLATPGGTPGDFDGDGAGDVFLYQPGTAADRIAWGDGAGGFALQVVRNVSADYEVVALDADADGRDDLAFSADHVMTGGHPTMNLWFGGEDRTFRRESREPFEGRGGKEVHRSHDPDHADTIISYWHSGADSWTIDPDGVTRVGRAGDYPGPWHLEPLIGRFDDDPFEDVFRYDPEGQYTDSLLLTGLRAVPAG